MCIIAIDPGYDRCGVAVLERQRGGVVLLFSTCITTQKKMQFSDRLTEVGKEVALLIKKYKPSACALERLYFNTNQKTAMSVSEVRGALIYIAGSSTIPVFEYTPPQIKAAVTGWGRADKNHIIQILPKLIHIEKKIQYDDEYDAIAVGITHLATHHPH